MSDVNAAVAELRDDNTVGGHDLTGDALRTVPAWLVRYLWSGAPCGKALLSVPFEGVLSVWMTWVQVGLGSLVLGVVLAAGVMEPWAYASGGVLGLAGLVILTVVAVATLTVDATLPPPRRWMPAETDDPFRPHDGVTGLLPVAPGLHVAQQPLVFQGLRVGARMSVFDSGAGLVVYSPIQATEALLEAVRALGTVTWIVAPNTLHHLFVAGWAEAFPEAKLLAAPGLADRRPDLAWTATLGSEDHAPWPSQHIDTEVFRGHALHEEIVLLHKPSGTLVVSDLILNLGQDAETCPAKQERLLKVTGMWQRPGPPVDWKMTLDNPSSIREAAERVLTWDVRTIVPAHGPIIRQDARNVFADAFAFVR